MSEEQLFLNLIGTFAILALSFFLVCSIGSNAGLAENAALGKLYRLEHDLPLGLVKK